jgi:hypothetical protein
MSPWDYWLELIMVLALCVQKSESIKLLQKKMLPSSTEIYMGHGKHFNYIVYSFSAFLFYIVDSLVDTVHECCQFSKFYNIRNTNNTNATDDLWVSGIPASFPAC